MREFETLQLTREDIGVMHSLLDVFGEVFDEREVYGQARPSEAYLNELLSGDSFIAVGALADGNVIGGLAAYELRKFEQERREIYIYDLAVTVGYRRRGVATALIEHVRHLASKRGTYVVFVQADYGDEPAIELYSKFGKQQNVLHFDIDPKARGSGA